MTNQSNVEMYRQELKTLAEIQSMEIGPATKKGVHDRMLLIAFKLKEKI